MRNKGKGKSVAGTAVTPPGSDGFSLISNDKLLELYANLLKWRIVEQVAAAHRKIQRTKDHSTVMRGCEASTVGATVDLGGEDIVSSLNHATVAGAPIEALLHSFGTNGSTNNRQSKSKPNNSARGNGASPASTEHQKMHAVIGAALASKSEKNGRVAVVFGLDGAGEEWNRAIQIASAHGLPIIFVNQQSRNAKAANRTRSGNAAKAAKPEAPYFPSITVDGHDVVAVYRVAYEAISRARQGRGPTLIDCQPFQLSGKVDALQNLNGSATNRRHAFDSVSNMENYLRGKDLFNRKLKSSIIADFTTGLGAVRVGRAGTPRAES